MLLSEMDDALAVYLGVCYSADDWVEPRHLLFSGDEDNAKSVENLMALKKTYIPDTPEKSSVCIPALTNSHLSNSRVQKS
jgi:hypothetical protein